MSLPIIYTNKVKLGNEQLRWDVGVTGANAAYDIYCNEYNLSGPTGPEYSLVRYPVTLNRGKTLVVDSVKGNDTYAITYPYSYPFKNVQSAINSSTSGDTVFIYPGVYEEIISVKTGIAVRGINVQTVTISKTGVTGNTTLMTMDSNCRVEDVTLSLTGATGGITLTGLELINTAPQTSKLRTAVVNVSNYNYPSSVLYGVNASGTTSNVMLNTPNNAIRASTINVNSGVTGSTGCALMVTGANRTTCRDSNFFCNGPTGYAGDTGSHFSGCCINSGLGNTGALGLYSSTVSGSTYDVARQNGNIILFGFTDLINSTTNGASFNVATQVTTQTFTISGNFNSSGTYYMVPGSVAIGDAPTSDYTISFDQNVIIISTLFNWQGVAIPIGQSITADIYKNSSVGTPIYTQTLNSATSNIVDTTKSVTFKGTDKMIIKITVSGSIGKGILLFTVAEY